MSMVLTFRAGKFTAVAATLVAVVTGLAACSREQQDWRSAEASDTVEAYSDFLKDHPSSELVRQARARLTQLSEDRAWSQAGSADTVEAYKQFLAQYPNGKWSQEAHIRVENFELAAAGTAVAGAIGSGSSAAALSTNGLSAGTAAPAIQTSAVPAAQSAAQPTPGAAAQLPTPPAGATAGEPTSITTAWRSADPTSYGVQLGAFASETAATSEWQLLVERFNAQLRGLAPHVVSAETATGRLFRLQALVADEATARALCDMLKKQSQACVPVLPH
jgi:cell division septation protein DedD